MSVWGKVCEFESPLWQEHLKLVFLFVFFVFFFLLLLGSFSLTCNISSPFSVVNQIHCFMLFLFSLYLSNQTVVICPLLNSLSSLLKIPELFILVKRLLSLPLSYPLFLIEDEDHKVVRKQFENPRMLSPYTSITWKGHVIRPNPTRSP